MAVDVHQMESLGLSVKGVGAYLDALKKKNIEMHSVIVMRHGQRALTLNFAPYDDVTPHMLFSLSKSFTSAAVGFAVSEGLLRYDDRIADIFADRVENPSDRKSRITLGHLLCMGSGLAPESDHGTEDQDWVRAILAHEVQFEPGEHFHYNSHGTYLCSAAVQKATGMTVRDYLYPRLFKPLHIRKPKWDSCPMGVNCGGWGLHLSSSDIAKFGQCVLNDGVYEGKRVLPEGFVAEHTRKHIENGDDEHNEWAQGYGYQFWRCRHNRFRGDGMYGQICLIAPDKDTVIACTAGTNDMGTEIALIQEILIPAIDDGESLATPAARRALAKRIERLDYPFPTGDLPPLDKLGVYSSEDGERLELSLDHDNQLLLKASGSAHYDRVKMTFAASQPREQPAPYSRIKCVLSCAYNAKNDTLTTCMRMLGAPMSRTETLRFTKTGAISTITGAGFARGRKVFKKIK